MKDGVKRYLGRLRNYLVNLPRSRKTAVTLVADFFGFAISAIAALAAWQSSRSSQSSR
jgi:hypothetical protein